jgi:tripartite-type tricarboxylate transporter receptor subunit TctC
VPYAFDDFAAVTIVAKGPLVLVVHPQFEAKSVRDLIAMAKAAPGKLNFASGGNGSSLHLAGELFKLEAGIDMVHVPYKGTNALLPDLLAGRVPIAFISPLTAYDYVKDGRLRALGVTSSQRAAGWPDVPTISEAGLSGYEMEAWYALLVPAGTPADVQRQLNTSVAKALASPEISKKLSGLGMAAVGNTPEEASAFVKDEAAKWAKVARAANIKAD